MSETIERDKVAYEIPDYKGFTGKITYLKQPKGDALVEIFLNGELHRDFLFPAYKIYNIGAHWFDIVEGELQKSDSGYRAAAWNGISGAVVLVPTPEASGKEGA